MPASLPHGSRECAPPTARDIHCGRAVALLVSSVQGQPITPRGEYAVPRRDRTDAASRLLPVGAAVLTLRPVGAAVLTTAKDLSCRPLRRNELGWCD